MARLIRSVDDEAPITCWRFSLEDVSGYGQEDEEEIEHGLPVARQDGLSLGQAELVSRAGARMAVVRMEAWDAEPGEEPREPWATAGSPGPSAGDIARSARQLPTRSSGSRQSQKPSRPTSASTT
ncbi:hypothetical protein ACIBHY_52690 [Nonomuraea sp. NPDC050547]|uniref:hypothetical protein n=1 Tax=unclassified Nonomuraea TaxID=2593643 RepID=UPI0037949E85